MKHIISQYHWKLLTLQEKRMGVDFYSKVILQYFLIEKTNKAASKCVFGLLFDNTGYKSCLGNDCLGWCQVTRSVKSMLCAIAHLKLFTMLFSAAVCSLSFIQWRAIHSECHSPGFSSAPACAAVTASPSYETTQRGPWETRES